MPPPPSLLLLTAAASLVTGAAMGLAWANRRRPTPAPTVDDDDGGDRRLRRVLDYWFDRARHGDDIQKNLWFVQDEVMRGKVDEEVRREFGDLLSSLDLSESEFRASCKTPEEVVAYVIVLDQLARHIHRGNDEAIERFGIRAREIVQRGIDTGFHRRISSLEHLCFYLMPFRHERPVNVARLELVVDLCGVAENRAILQRQVMTRFKRVSENRLTEALVARPELKRRYQDEEILEPVPSSFRWDTYIPSGEDLKTMRSHNVYVLVKRFVLQRLEIETDSSYPMTFMVSLSGGVDSMVLTRIIVDVVECLSNDSTLTPRKIRVAATHVNYGNRAEADAEADFVRRWCERYRVEFHCTRVADLGLLRGITDREEYEERSREVRFDLYKRVWGEYFPLPNGEKNDDTYPPRVLFGHHQGDVVENVISNAMKGRTIVELSGMTAESTISGCVVQRPMLALTKEAIFDFAHAFNVPYFLDTTPKWSTRGQLRHELLPTIERVYGAGYFAHLVDLARQSDEVDAMLARRCFDRCVLKIQHPAASLVAYAVDFRPPVEPGGVPALEDIPMFLWRLTLRRAAHVGKVLAPKERAVSTVVNLLRKGRQGDKKKKGPKFASWTVEMRSSLVALVYRERYLLVFKPQPRLQARCLTRLGRTKVDDDETTSLAPHHHALSVTPLVISPPNVTRVVYDGLWEVEIFENDSTRRRGNEEEEEEEDDVNGEYWKCVVLGIPHATMEVCIGKAGEYVVVPPSPSGDVARFVANVPQVLPRAREEDGFDAYKHQYVTVRYRRVDC